MTATPSWKTELSIFYNSFSKSVDVIVSPNNSILFFTILDTDGFAPYFLQLIQIMMQACLYILLHYHSISPL